MKQIKKSFALVLALVLTLCLLAGCGSGSKAEEGTSEEVASEEVTLTFLNVYPIDEINEHYENYIEAFEESHPGVHIEYTTVPWDEAYKKVVAMSASDTLPDVLTGDVRFMLTLAADDKIEDLTQAWEDSGYYADLCTAGKQSMDQLTYNDAIYIIPDGYSVQGIYVNTKMLENAGYDVEELQSNWTWDKYFEVVKATTVGDQYGMSFRGGSNGFMRFYEYLCNCLDVDGMFPYGNNVSILEDPRALECFEEFYGLYTEGYSPQDSINWAFKEMVEGFVGYQTATLNNTMEVTTDCSNRMEDGDWTVLPYPNNADGTSTKMVWGYSAGLMVSSGSEHSDLAKEFVMYLSSPEVNIDYCKALIAMPIYTNSLSDPYFSEGVFQGFANTMNQTNLTYLTQPSDLTQWGYFTQEYAVAECQKYMAGEQSAQETLDNMAEWLSNEYDTDIGG